ncbi:MAG: hypothetical protein JXQ71_10095 [Verrucomicrobia bacterium]|nr:hypothetical protein [Verrucomicrobiota bacterium]
MKVLITIFAALSFPILLLNVFGGIASGIWLAILGEWNPILIGIFGFFGGTFLLTFAIMPGFLLGMLAVSFGEKTRYVAMFALLLVSSAYTFSVITIWCAAVLWFFMQLATQSILLPLLLWSYVIAIGPIKAMAARDKDSDASVLTLFFAELAYIAAGLWVLFGDPAVPEVLTLMGCIMALGMITMLVNAMTLITRNENG